MNNLLYLIITTNIIIFYIKCDSVVERCTCDPLNAGTNSLGLYYGPCPAGNLPDDTQAINTVCTSYTDPNLNCTLYPILTSYNFFYCDYLTILPDPNIYFKHSQFLCASNTPTGNHCIQFSIPFHFPPESGSLGQSYQSFAQNSGFLGGYCGCRSNHPEDCPGVGQLCNAATSLCMCRANHPEDCPLGVCDSTTGICKARHNNVADCNYRGDPDLESNKCNCWDSANKAYETFSINPNKPIQPFELDAHVFGPRCDTDKGQQLYCNGHGTPICPPILGIHDDALDIRSLSTGLVIGVKCTSYLPFVFQRKFQCLCDYNWTPDFGGVLDPSTQIPNSLCSVEGFCHGQSGALLMGIIFGCQCITNTYPVNGLAPVETTKNPSGSLCIGNCFVDRCSSRGICGFDKSVFKGCNLASCLGNISDSCQPYCNIPTIYLNADGSLVNPFMNTCNCLSGWTNPFTLDPASFSSNIYCQVPYNSNVNGGAHCGHGSWISDPSPNIFSGHCSCSSFVNQLARDSSNNPISVTVDNYYLANSRRLCVQTCPTLNAQTYDPMMVAGDSPPTNPNGPTVGISFNNLVCGGDRRGVCVSDGNEGTICQCKNGYYGIACETVLCPLAFGMICGGNGVCDSQTNTCICKNSEFIGQACEIREAACSISQPVKSNPTTDTINIPNDLTPLSQL